MSLHLISASAGTGKTERLSRVVADALAAPDAARIPVEGLVAVTYTRKAEAELKARIRQTLIKRGAYDEAQRLPLAYVGTVHAICRRLLDEFAIAAGLSPAMDVLPEGSAERAISEALEVALDRDHLRRLDAVARRLRPNWDVNKRRYRWVADAEDLIELARSNRIDPAALPSMARRSLDRFQPLLGARHDDGQAIDDGLREQIAQVLDHLGDGDDTKVTGDAIDSLRRAREEIKFREDMPWATWVQLSRLEAAKAHTALLAGLHRAAARHREHPRFHDDVADYTRLLYQAVEQGLESYSAWKAERRYIDYVDMEERALDLLARPEVAADLKRRLHLLVVDEFQDTSPIQLALFLALERLCQRSVWVGDRKQSIFAFRGADPMLMDAVVAATEAAGTATEVLHTNYRSRRALVEFTSELFACAFAPHGYRAEQVRVDAIRGDEDQRLAQLAPLGMWLLETKTVEQDAEAIAVGVQKMLARAADTPVIDRKTGAVRDVCAADIAILAATNDETTRLANELAARGIRAVVARKGLLGTPEGTLLQSALRLVADERDVVARAHLDALGGFVRGDPGRWLEGMIAATAENPRPATELVALIEQRRVWLARLAPAELVDELIGHLDLCRRCLCWPRPEERLANLDAFRALAAQYESECEAERAAGSVIGLLRFLAIAATSLRPDSDRDRRDDQHAGGAEAVEICTYHRAKGLEWPVVILASLHSKTRAFGIPPDAAAMRLERGGRSQLFSAAPESESARFDAHAPLAGRWLRFWPWPYGGLKTSELVDRVTLEAESQRVVNAAARESLRLLYVGFTRARDHLVLAMRAARKKPKGKKTAAALQAADVALHAEWLKTINDGKHELLELPTGDDEAQTVNVSGGDAERGHQRARVWWLTASAPLSAAVARVTRLWYAGGGHASRPRYGIAPSRASEDWPEFATAELAVQVHTIGPRLPCSLGEQAMNEVGDAVHAFFAADPMNSPNDDRCQMAERILSVRGCLDVVRAQDLVTVHDRLREFLDRRYAGAAWQRETPIVAKVATLHGRRQIVGSIDLLLTTATGRVIVDHKTYPGVEWEARAREYAAQLAIYRHVLEAEGTRPVIAELVHFPFAGKIVECARQAGDPAMRLQGPLR